jgi:hypothetical protein
MTLASVTYLLWQEFYQVLYDTSQAQRFDEISVINTAVIKAILISGMYSE